jgi:hypothetical protein
VGLPNFLFIVLLSGFYFLVLLKVKTQNQRAAEQASPIPHLTSPHLTSGFAPFYLLVAKQLLRTSAFGFPLAPPTGPVGKGKSKGKPTTFGRVEGGPYFVMDSFPS